MAVFDLKNATVTIKDGTATPLTLAAKVGDGNLQFTEKRNIEYKMDRGFVDTTRLGNQEPMEVKLEFNWIFLRGDTGDYTANNWVNVISIRDAFTQTGGASAWVSSDTVDVVILYAPCAGKTETITLKYFRYEQLDYDAKAGTISVSGKCNVVAPTLIRT
jgi:hypothetical protein